MIEKSRKTVFISSTILLIYIFSDAKISSINSPGVSLTLGNPSVILHFMWLTHIYLYYRMLLLFKNAQMEPLSKISGAYLRVTPYIRKLMGIKPTGAIRTYSETHPWVRRRFMRRYLETIKTNDDGSTEIILTPIPLRKIFIPELISDLYAIKSLSFIESTIPKIYGLSPIIIYLINLIFKM